MLGSFLPQRSGVENKDRLTKLASVERSISYVKRVESKPLSLFFTIVTILLFLQIGIVTIVGAIENICKS